MELFWEAFPGVPYRVETSVDGLDWTPAGTVQAPEADSMAFLKIASGQAMSGSTASSRKEDSHEHEGSPVALGDSLVVSSGGLGSGRR